MLILYTHLLYEIMDAYQLATGRCYLKLNNVVVETKVLSLRMTDSGTAPGFKDWFYTVTWSSIILGDLIPYLHCKSVSVNTCYMTSHTNSTYHEMANHATM